MRATMMHTRRYNKRYSMRTMMSTRRIQPRHVMMNFIPIRCCIAIIIVTIICLLVKDKHIRLSEMLVYLWELPDNVIPIYNVWVERVTLPTCWIQ